MGYNEAIVVTRGHKSQSEINARGSGEIGLTLPPPKHKVTTECQAAAPQMPFRSILS